MQFFSFALFLQMNLLKLAGLGKIEEDAAKNSEDTKWSKDIAKSFLKININFYL